MDGRGLGWANFYFNGRYDVMFQRMDAMDYSMPPYSEKYPILLKLFNDEPEVPKNKKIIHNVSFGGRWLNLYNGLDCSIVSVKNNLIADPDL